ncbi:uncharacterized protein LOC117172411 [Belonocnema kinseyi]|uniref:uncharacterized protein LOC117172411 n=1 Tax=Belonocnema kinseyi TaxID=2817044 RepID=UPI00143D4793|nr:uncharacterized protein LOC117172411 [Belonocnema kinseyi]XP_033216209.1 uncharacterized protein LOC117172411 [Belonocnema kinseyi]XP_033216211.1 uncharacterized protein LOC117172411 [Belonocnema kinseyi]XP_033216212.1 uncharacterized protein LOC117172411 [Belonocnema kinseyi]
MFCRRIEIVRQGCFFANLVRWVRVTACLLTINKLENPVSRCIWFSPRIFPEAQIRTGDHRRDYVNKEMDNCLASRGIIMEIRHHMHLNRTENRSTTIGQLSKAHEQCCKRMYLSVFVAEAVNIAVFTLH